MSKPTRRYWDSVLFLGIFNDEPEKVAACRGVIQQAHEGKVQIVTSAFTLTEVLKIKGYYPQYLGSDKENLLRDFFEHEFIVLVNVDRLIAETARSLIWAHSHLKPKDAIHAATAVLTPGVTHIDTFDTDFTKLEGALMTSAGTPLVIGPPNEPYQGVLALPGPGGTGIA